jgi:hypothetical protein
MGMLVMLLPAGLDATLTVETAAGLSELGVTSVSLLCDEAGGALVLDGWSFDPDRSAATIATLLAPGDPGARALRPVFRTSISNARDVVAWEASIKEER